MKRIVIDFQSSQGESSHRGIGKYTYSLFTALIPILARDYEVIVLLSGNFFPDHTVALRQKIETIAATATFEIRTWNGLTPTHEHLEEPENTKRNVINEAIYRNYLRSLAPDFILYGSMLEGWSDNCTIAVPQGIPYGTIFYDAIPMIYPAQYLDPNPTYKEWYLEHCKLIQNADLLLSISNSASKEAVDYFHVAPEKIVNIAGASILTKANPPHEPIDNTPISAILKKFNIAKPYILYTGATDSRKNHLRLIKAFANLPQNLKNKYQLVIAGGMPPVNLAKFTQMCHLNNLKVPTEVCFTNKVSEHELKTIYANAYLFIMPSTHEGFGLPILEAMEFDLPVLGSNNSSIPEIIKQDFAMFDPTDVEDISQKMYQALTDVSYLARLKQNGISQRQFFSWPRSALTAKQAITQFLIFAPQPDKALIKNSVEKINYSVLKNKDIVKLAKAISDNTPRTKPRFYVDVTEYHITDSKSGIQRVVKNILNELYGILQNSYEVIPVYRFVPPHQQYYNETYHTHYRRSTKTEEAVRGVFGNEDHVVDFKDKDIVLVLDLTMETSIHSAHLLSQARAKGTKVYYVVYDLLPMQFPEFFPNGLPTVFGQWLRQLTLHSDGIMCISKTVADELLTWIKEEGIQVNHALKIGWFHLGVDFQSANSSKGLPSNAPELIDKIKNTPSFLMVGTVEPRKAHLQVIMAFDELWKKGIDVNLIIVGKQGWNTELTIDMIESNQAYDKKLIWLKSASDELLASVFKHSAALIAASYGEGFGLPIIEAGYYGIPIIARDIPVFREVATSNTAFFTANTPSQLASFLQHWLKKYNPKQAHVINPNAGITWKQGTAQLLANIFDETWHIDLPYLQGHAIRRCRYDNPNEMASLVGDRSGFELKTTGEEGYFVYGPYWQLEPNKYRLDMKLVVNNPSHAFIDAAYNEGSVILFKKMLREFNIDKNGSTTVQIEFTLSEAISDFELHIWVDKEADLKIREYVLREIG